VSGVGPSGNVPHPPEQIEDDIRRDRWPIGASPPPAAATGRPPAPTTQLIRERPGANTPTSRRSVEHTGAVVHPFWPLFDLEVRTPLLTLRYPDDALMIELVTLIGKGIHDPDDMPFSLPWTDEVSPGRDWNSYRYWWRTRADLSPDTWTIDFAVVLDSRVAGATGLSGDHFRTLRTFETGSWLGKEFQGRGIGKEMRAATLHLGFAGFGAEEATTTAFANNARSLGVTRSLGYEPNGRALKLQRDRAGESLRFRMTRAHWETIRRDDIELVGVEPCLSLLGLT
jgi:RimJ/RimL family protein N-acetyltransferase